jgi:hypothetical protein
MRSDAYQTKAVRDLREKRLAELIRVLKCEDWKAERLLADWYRRRPGSYQLDGLFKKAGLL